MYVGQKKKEEEKNVEQKFHRDASYNFNMINDDKKGDSKSNDDYISRKKVVFNVDNNNNIPVRLRYKIKNSKDKMRILTDMEDPNYKKEEMNGRNQNLKRKRYLLFY